MSGKMLMTAAETLQSARPSDGPTAQTLHGRTPATADDERCRVGQALSLLDSFTVGTLVVDDTCRPLVINKRAQEIIDTKDGIFLQHGRLAANSAASTTALRQAVAAASEAGPSDRPAQTIILALKRQEAQRELIVSVRPMNRNGFANHAFRGAYMVICDPHGSGPVQPNWLRSIYGLTPAEARLTVELARGGTLEDAAKTLGITIGTARVHLKHIFNKTETNRQPELVRLLLSSGMNLFNWRERPIPNP
ncbi:MAG TPA: helix-turn-helix transcriptional regulator [Azospirillum sp.]|nr:helix-turn-helix transcriptional regulator [Azospirillum sp.]